MAKGRLILVPAWLHEANSADQFPAESLQHVHTTRHFIVERAKTARHFLKSIGYPLSFDEVQMEELDKHNDDNLTDLLMPCIDGNDVGLLSEAGVPAVADPGGLIVDAAHRMGVEVVPLIGPSSILLALMASGMNGQRFLFQGYLPRDERELTSSLKDAEAESRQHDTTHIFIETPYRNDRLLAAMLKVLAPSTRIAVASDLTAPSQSIQQRTVSEWKKSPLTIGKKPTVFLLFSGKLST